MNNHRFFVKRKKSSVSICLYSIKLGGVVDFGFVLVF